MAGAFIRAGLIIRLKISTPLVTGVIMRNLRALSLASLCAVALICPYTVKAEDAVVSPILQKKLPDIAGKEAVMLVVDYPPGAVDPIHRHNAHVFVYVLEGSVVMQVRGGRQVTLKPGQTFYEGPNDVHTVGRNASTTEPAKFLVFLVKNEGAPALIPAK